MIDGTAVIEAGYAVFDPQNSDGPESFAANGSRANHLALVLNRHEANLLAPGYAHLKAEDFATALAKQENAEVVVIKMGPLGALVYERGQFLIIGPDKLLHCCHWQHVQAVPTLKASRWSSLSAI
ncbi:hypothetical protein [Pseudomonas juntendi]|uniref:hypothetical protein n=1 Tax=Pseudomonas juntendi TaxID=2666183 RepID=UPI0021751F6E|nr:hypothetical protein [Pseudomonas juntendi]